MRPLIILHVEDNREDALLLVRACQVAKLEADFHEVPEGGQAVAYLKGAGTFADRQVHPFPDLVILDLKMPGMNGFDFLRWLRGESAYQTLPVLVFTGSTFAGDRTRLIAEGANGYFVKPVDFGPLVQLAESFRAFDRRKPD